MGHMPGASTYTRVVQADEVRAALGPFDELTPVGDRSGSGECWRGVGELGDHVVKVVVHEHEPGRFAREVDALSRLESERVMRVVDQGEIDTASGTFPYLRSEFVPGVDLRSHIADSPATEDAALRSMLLELLRGLAELSSARIVHRDLKPENIILRDGDWSRPVIIDLGLSRLVDASSFTIYPWAGGTWPYMAPEQLRAERANDRSDVWAAAVIAAELASGVHPFFRGEPSLPRDWDERLQRGASVPDSRSSVLREWIARATHYRGYRRPSAVRSLEMLEADW